MNKYVKLVMQIFGLVLFAVSLYLLGSVDWRIVVGVFLFGWASNIENFIKTL
jgi:hypothetical protein